MQHPERHIFGFTAESLRETMSAAKMEPYRAEQVLKWVYGQHTIDPGAMTDLGAADRARVVELIAFESGEVVADRVGSDGTRKLLVRWREGERALGGDIEERGRVVSLAVAKDDGRDKGTSPTNRFAHRGREERDDLETECVMIPTEDRRTACISSQVGCPVGCTFCASGIGGLDGNLSAGRIVEQAWRLARDLAAKGERLSHVVFMGMGEPLANYGPVVEAVRILTAEWGMGISARRITISTVGLPAGIRRLADEEVPATLAISLHAPNDELRRRLIPWAEYTTIAELMAAGQYYFEKTGREVTLEYILLGGVNDRAREAEQLASVARTLRANVNLIRYNEVAGLPFARPETEDVLRFQAVLRAKGVNAHIRASRGRDIEAACGQLRHELRKGR